MQTNSQTKFTWRLKEEEQIAGKKINMDVIQKDIEIWFKDQIWNVFSLYLY